MSRMWRRATKPLGDLPSPAEVRAAMRAFPSEGLLTRKQFDLALGVPLSTAVVQTLALLACRPHECVTAAREVAAGGPTPYLRACVLEGLRLTSGSRHFAPEEWLDGAPSPIAERLLELAQAALAELIRERGYELLGQHLGEPLPPRIDPARFRFAVHPVGAAAVRHAVPVVPRQRVDRSLRPALDPAGDHPGQTRRVVEQSGVGMASARVADLEDGEVRAATRAE